jgi:hypothetical protein
MSKCPMRGHFRYLRFKTFSMTPRTPQCEVFWAFLLSSKHSGVPEDSNPHFFQVLGFTPTLGQSRVATSCPPLESTTSTSDQITLLNPLKVLLPHIPQLCIILKQELVKWIHALVNPLTRRIHFYCIILLLIWTLCTFPIFLLIIFYCKVEHYWLGLTFLHMELKG